MGKFEVKTHISKEYPPENVSLLVQSTLFGKDRDDLKDKILKSVDEIKQLISGIYTHDFEVTYSNIKYSESSFKPDKRGIFKNMVVEDKIANFNIIIDLDLGHGIDQEKLEELVSKLVMIDSVSTINYMTDLKDRESKLEAIKKELCEKCRKEAEIITASLGSEILGIESIVYHSSGILIKNSSSEDTFSRDYGNSFGDCDLCNDDECDFGGLESMSEKGLSIEEEFERSKKALKELGKGIVKGIIENKISIDDDITVVFNVR